MEEEFKQAREKFMKFERGLTNTQKLMVSVISALLFALISSPFLYKFVNKVTSGLGLSIADSNGCPNNYGLLVHTIVFGIIVRLIMM